MGTDTRVSTASPYSAPLFSVCVWVTGLVGLNYTPPSVQRAALTFFLLLDRARTIGCRSELTSLHVSLNISTRFLPDGGAMAFTWHGAARAEEVVNLGPLALIQPLLDQLDIAGIIDRHLPPDPQLEFSEFEHYLIQSVTKRILTVPGA